MCLVNVGFAYNSTLLYNETIHDVKHSVRYIVLRIETIIWVCVTLDLLHSGTHSFAAEITALSA